MTTWLQTGRPAVLEVLNAVCDQIDASIQTELRAQRSREETLLAELGSLKARAAHVDRLELENKTLKEELQQLRAAVVPPGPEPVSRALQQTSDGSTGPSSRRPLGEVSPNRVRAQPRLDGSKSAKLPPKGGAEVADARRDWNKLAAKYAAVVESREQERAALRKRKEECIRWATYTDSLEKKVKKLEKKLAAHKNGPDRISTAELASAEHGRPSKLAAANLAGTLATPSSNSSFLASVGAAASFSGEDEARKSISLSPRRAISLPAQESVAGAKDDDHSDSTQGETPCPADTAAELPTLLQENTVNYGVRVKEEPSSDGPVFVSERPVRKRRRFESSSRVAIVPVKSESDSSGPLITAEALHFSPQDSIDLESTVQAVRTPRKRRHVASADSDAETGREGPGETRWPPIFGRSRAGAAGPAELVEKDSPAVAQDALQTCRSPLLPVPANHSKWSKPTTTRKRPRSLLQLDHGVKDLAEDGEDTPFTPGSVRAEGLPAAATRVDELLNRRASTNKTPVPRSIQKNPRTAPFSEDIPAPRVLPFGNEVRGGIRETVETPAPQPFHSSKSAVSRGRDYGRTSAQERGKAALRSKPVSSLNLDDFKVNPKFNNGHDFAFSEVVRGRGEREALPGCVDPNCCGKAFRSLAQAERRMAGPSIATRAEDIRLLEQYLGDDAFRLGTMTMAEKEETWLEAKTRELANKYGKHRHRYARRSSPPGFWNVDWPSTQEQQREREEAARIEKALVQERYRDAMRGNGRWLFRDE